MIKHEYRILSYMASVFQKRYTAEGWKEVPLITKKPGHTVRRLRAHSEDFVDLSESYRLQDGMLSAPEPYPEYSDSTRHIFKWTGESARTDLTPLAGVLNADITNAFRALDNRLSELLRHALALEFTCVLHEAFGPATMRSPGQRKVAFEQAVWHGMQPEEVVLGTS